MERINGSLSDKEKAILLNALNRERKDRIEENAPYALYVAISTPKPDLAVLTSSILTVLLNESDSPVMAERWAATWGKVVICVAPEGKTGLFLGLTIDPKNKRFVPVATNRFLGTEEMEELIYPLPKGETITVNRQPMTIEAFLIVYVHMVDELIWNIYRKRCVVADLRYSDKLYKESVATVAERGITAGFKTTDEILFAKTSNPNVAVRLYGSGVNRQVPKVMGGVCLEGYL